MIDAFDVSEDFATILADNAPALFAKLSENYADPEYDTVFAGREVDCCKRCGALVDDAPRHNQFHRNLTFGIVFAQQLAFELAHNLEGLAKEVAS